ncbi:MAG: cytochrome c3 family protein [Candidatus Neomarinimicrobiota bacterium]
MWRFRLFLITTFLLATAWSGDYIMFPHQLHLEDLEMSCSDCHADVGKSTAIPPRLLPEKDTCIGCHDGDTATEDCEACHSDPDEPLPFTDSQRLSGLDFSHAYHIGSGQECTTCHAYVEEESGGGPARLWTRSDCQSCHSSAAPKSHAADWSWLHGIEVMHQTKSSCSTCHQQATCDACHLVQNVEPANHPAAFMLAHGLEAYAALNDCSTCHHPIKDCLSCHRSNLVMPVDHNLPDWASPTRGGLHGERAEQEPDICLVCHQPASDNTCRRCHGG